MHGLRRSVLALCATLVLPAPLALAQAPAPDWSMAETIEVDLTNFAFSPARLELKPGAVYRLRFVNRTSGAHDFTAKAFFDDATIDPDDQDKLKDGMVMLAGGQSAEVRLVASKAGRYEAKCTHFMHATLGMKGEVLVQGAP